MTAAIVSLALIFTPAPLTAPKETPQWLTPAPPAAIQATTFVNMDESVLIESFVVETTEPVTSVSELSEAPSLPPPITSPPPIDTTPLSLTDAQLYRLRMCESTDNYGAHLVWGTGWESRATGAYQFEQPTWDGVAARHMPWLIGVRPHHAWPAEQDAMTRWLWSERGRQPWPVCGLRVGAP